MSVASGRQQPYVGPQAFSRGDVAAGRELYGRERDVDRLVDLLISQRVVVLHSPSGAGKTSLIHARLIAALEAENFHVLPVVRVGLQTRPDEITGAPRSTNRYVLSTLHCLEATGADAVDLPTWFDRPAGDEARYPLIIFDQFEEILTADPTDRAAKEEFFIQLGTVLRNRGRWALIAMREDFVSALEPYVNLVPTRLTNRYRLDLLDDTAALAAASQPAARAGVPFAAGAARELVDELRQTQVQRPDGQVETVSGPYVEPVQLQVVCYSLWQRLPPDVTEITSEHVHRFGDVNQALTDFYERTLALAARQPGVSMHQLRQWFGSQLITSGGTRGLVYRGVTDTARLPNAAVDVLEQEHLIRAETRAGARWYELIHDRFVPPILASNAAWEQRRRVGRLAPITAVAVVLLLAVTAGLFLSLRKTDAVQQELTLRDEGPELLVQAQAALSVAVTATAVAERTDSATPAVVSLGPRPTAVQAPPGPRATATRASATRTPDVVVAGALATPSPSRTPTTVAAPAPAVFEIGQSTKGQPRVVSRSGSGPRRVALVGSLHGGEELPAYNLLLSVPDALKAGTLRVPPELTLYVLPTLNPDDLEAKTGFNARGVDLNRNFPPLWVAATCGSPTGYRYRRYGGCKKDGGGSAAFSEAESNAARNFVERERLTAVVIINSGLATVSSRNGGGWGDNLGRAISEQFGLEFMASCCRTYPVTGQFVDWVDTLGLTGVEVNAPDAMLEADGLKLIQFALDRLKLATCTPTRATGEFALRDQPRASAGDRDLVVLPGEEVTVTGWARAANGTDPWLRVEIRDEDGVRAGWMYTRETNGAQPRCDFDLDEPSSYTFPSVP